MLRLRTDKTLLYVPVAFHTVLFASGVLASEGWWEAWQPSPQGNQELLVVRDDVGRSPGELGLSESVECDIFPSLLWHCWLGDRKGIRPVKNWLLVCWWWISVTVNAQQATVSLYAAHLQIRHLIWWFDWSFARLIAPVVTTTSIILCFNEHRLTQVHLENDR